MKAATFCLKVLGSDSRSIGEPLTLGRLQGNAGTAHVINFKFGAGVLAEIKFGQIAVKVLLATMLVNADHAALEHAEKAFKGIGVNLAAVLARADIALVVIDALMFQAGVDVDAAAIGMQDGAGQHVAFQNVLNGDLGGFLDALAADLAAALNKAHDLLLMTHATPSLLAVLAISGADVGFVGLDDLATATKRASVRTGGHRFPDAVAKEPSGFHGARQIPLDLTGADPLLAGAHQMNDLKPQVQGKMAALENGPLTDGKGLPAGIALVQADPGGLAVHGLGLA